MKRIRYIAALALVTVLLSGCSFAGREVYFSFHRPGTVFTICGMSCSKKEAKVYIANYKNLYGRVGTTDLWDGNFDSARLETGLKQSVINHLSKIYSLNVYAKNKEIELDDSEKTKVDEATKEYYDSLSAADKKYLNVSKSDIRAYYERYAIASRVYDELMSAVDDEISEDEARIMDAYVIHVTDASKYEEVKKKLAEGGDFESLTAVYSVDDNKKLSFGRGTYPEEVEEVAFSLDDGEISEGIEAEDGYYFVKCVDKYNEERSEENKSEIVAKRQSDVFNDIVEEQKTSGSSTVNISVWNNLHIDDGEGVTTDSFFSIIENHL